MVASGCFFQEVRNSWKKLLDEYAHQISYLKNMRTYQKRRVAERKMIFQTGSSFLNIISQNSGNMTTIW